jgi:putative phosphoribosyl transferase
MTVEPFKDRQHAGTLLARRREQCAGRTDTVVIALPRGGIPLAEPIARQLHLPLGQLKIRK